MRFPSFIRVPRNRRFEITPRYYDPVKEELAERTERIKQEMDGKNDGTSYSPGRISFERRTSSVPNTSFMQMGIAAILGILVVGWLYFGNTIFYLLWLAVPVYLFFRIRSPRKPFK